jgi:hypothetical protein
MSGWRWRKLECLVDLGPASKVHVIGDQRKGGQVFQRQVLFLQQRMVRWRNHHVLPLVPGQRHQALVARDALGGDAQIGLVVQDHVGDLRRIALLDRQPHLRVALGELADHARQRVTGLGMGGGDGEVALILRRVVLAHALQAFHFLQDLLYRGQDAPPRFGQAADPFAVACEDIDTQLLFQFDNRLGNAGL